MCVGQYVFNLQFEMGVERSKVDMEHVLASFTTEIVVMSSCHFLSFVFPPCMLIMYKRSFPLSKITSKFLFLLQQNKKKAKVREKKCHV